jgi:SHS2 domain-containing protein
LFIEFKVEVSETGLRGEAVGEPWDPSKHRLEHEVKAVTYHGLRVEHDGGEWLAEIILDI